MGRPTAKLPVFFVAGAVSLCLVAGLSFVAFKSKQQPQGGAGFSSAQRVRDEVAPHGAPIGAAMLSPSTIGPAAAVQVPPPPSYSPLLPPPADLPLRDTNVDIYPGQVETVARIDDAMGAMGGVAVIGHTIYVLTDDSVRTLDPKTGKVAVLTGTPGSAGCTIGADATSTRLSGPAGDLSAEGKTLFAVTGCGIVRIDTATGATSQLTDWTGPMTTGPDGHLYVGATYSGAPIIARVDEETGDATTYLSLPDGGSVLGVATDASSVWALVDEGPSAPAVWDRVDFANGAVTRMALDGTDVAGAGQLASGGTYLYAPSVDHFGLLRLTKRLGAWGQAVGGDQGDNDGTWTFATFGSISGMASDGVSIWLADSGNGSIRRATFSQSAGLSFGS